MGKLIGIDLGTTNSVTAVYHDGGPKLLCPSPNNRTVPSMVAIDENGQWLVGEAARNQQITNPVGTIYSIKRFMGRRHSEVASEEKLVPYEIVGKATDFVQVSIGKKRYTPQELSARILYGIKRMAEAQLGEPIEGAIITVPAYFNDAQRQATRDAGKIAGLRIERIINEPTAAAVAYGLEKRGNRCVVVFDFGGGTFDLSAMKIESGTFRVLAVHGNSHLGGDDFDQRILDVVAEDFLRRERVDIRQDPMALQRLKRSCQEAKATLSARPEAKIMLPFICVNETGPKHLEYTMTRERFESICTDLFDGLKLCCRTLLSEANLKPEDIDEVVLVGGSTRIPRVQEVAREAFQTDELNRSINPDEVVAIGAGIIGGVIQGDLRNVELMDVTSHGFGVEIANGAMETLVEKNTPIPTTVSKVFSTPTDNQTSVPINVLEGESKKALENRPLGVFRLTGIRRAPRGVPRIEVQFQIDANGILEVSAKDQQTGKSQKIVVTGGCGFTDEEIDRMRDAERRTAVAEETQAAQVELRHHAEKVHSDITQWLNYNKTAIAPKALSQFSTALNKLESRIKKRDASGIKAALRKLGDLQKVHRKAG